MKKLTIILSGLLIMSLGFSHASFSGIVKSNSENNPNGVEINIHSDVDVYGVQFDLSYDNNLLSLSKDDIVSLIDQIDVYAKVFEGDAMARVIMFSMQGDRILDASSDNLASILDVKS